MSEEVYPTNWKRIVEDPERCSYKGHANCARQRAYRKKQSLAQEELRKYLVAIEWRAK
jgi:hypothetical protein